MDSLGKAGLRAVKWSAISTTGRFALQFIAQVILARLLGPENYGIFGIGMVVYTFSNFLVGFGFGWSLLQRATLTDEDIRFAFTWQLIAGSIALGGLFFSAHLIAEYFHDARVQQVVEWMALACLFNSATSPASNLLQRDLNFKVVGLIQIGSYACGYLAVGIPMALMGNGVNALVAAWLTQSAVAMLSSYAVKRHPIRPLLWYPGASDIFLTGGTVFATNIVNWSLNNLDRVLIGRFLNAHAVGLYTAGYNIAAMPNSFLLAALQPTFMAVSSRMQTDPERLGRVYFQMLSASFVLIVPIFAFLASVAPDLVQLLYGPMWSETSKVMTMLFLGMPAYMMWGFSTPILWNTGHKQYEFLLQVPVLCVGALGLFMFTRFGIQAAAGVASLIMVLRAAAVGIAALRAVGRHPQDLLPHILRGLILSGVSVSGAILGQYLASPLELPVVSLAFSGLLTLGVTALVVAIRPEILGESATEILVNLVPRLAVPLKQGVARTFPQKTQVSGSSE